VPPSTVYYSYIYDQATHTYFQPTVLPTTGLFPKPKAFERIQYNDRTDVPPSFNSTLTITYKRKGYTPLGV
jgi:hypothetical protein